jgi:hypothetical protein
MQCRNATRRVKYKYHSNGKDLNNITHNLIYLITVKTMTMTANDKGNFAAISMGPYRNGKNFNTRPTSTGGG